MSKYPFPGRVEFRRMMKEEPRVLLEWIQSGELEPADLTFAVEFIGDFPESEHTLRGLLSHEHSVVREGSLYGLMKMELSDIKSIYQKILEHDPSPGMKEIARNMIQYGS